MLPLPILPPDRSFAVLVESIDEVVELMVTEGKFSSENVDLFRTAATIKNHKKLMRLIIENFGHSGNQLVALYGALWNPALITAPITIDALVTAAWYETLEEITEKYPLHETHFGIIDMARFGWDTTQVGYHLATRPHSLSPEAQDFLFEHYRMKSWIGLAKRDDLTEKVMKKLVFSSANAVREVIASATNYKVPSNFADMLASDAYPGVRIAVAKNHFPLSHETWEDLACDPIAEVRAQVAQNLACPEEIRVLAAISTPEVTL